MAEVNVIKLLSTLDENEKWSLFSALQKHFNLITEGPSHRIVSEIQERKHDKGYTCPHCGSKRAVRNGTFKAKYDLLSGSVKRQRYRCKDCGKTFNDLTATPLYRSRHAQTWITFIKYMLEGYSLRKCAESLDVTHVTLFYWRHKILSALKKLSTESFEGIVEMDETYMLYSRKGQRGLEKPRKRGGAAKLRGISRDQVCILVVCDRQKNTFIRALCRGRIRTPLLELAVGNKITAANVLCTDAWRAFSTFAKNHDTEHYRFASTSKRRTVKGIYHIQNVNSFHSRFKKWLDHFNGVATKYMEYYLSWFRYLDANGTDITTRNTKDMLVNACLLGSTETFKSLRKAKCALA